MLRLAPPPYTPIPARRSASSGDLRVSPHEVDIHPDYHEITVIMTDGTIQDASCMNPEGHAAPDIDPKSHRPDH